MCQERLESVPSLRNLGSSGGNASVASVRPPRQGLCHTFVAVATSFVSSLPDVITCLLSDTLTPKTSPERS